jgi:outer membrane lipoprotein-sorting protein
MQWLPIIPFAVVLVFPTSPWAAPETAAEIEQCVQDNLPRKSSVQIIVLRSTNRVGDVTESDATIHWKLFDGKRSKVLLRFERPLDMRGAGMLLIEKEKGLPDTFIYLPELRMVRRVSSRAAASSLFGTDFSYEDFQRLVGMSKDASKERAADTKVSEREVYSVIGRPDRESGSAYERVVTFIDKETCVPLRTESYERGDELRKLLTADASKIEREGGLWVPREQTMKDLRDETQTDLIIEQIEVDAKIHDKMFSARELEAGAH